MEVPRSLYHTNVYYHNNPGEGRIVEAGDEAANVLMAPTGMQFSDEDAKRLGITDYLAQHPEPPTAETPPAAPEAKAVEQSTVEDKAVDAPTAESKTEEPAPDTPSPSERRGGQGRRP